MNFEFSEEQQFIRDQARNFLSQECTTAVVRGVLEDLRRDALPRQAGEVLAGLE